MKMNINYEYKPYCSEQLSLPSDLISTVPHADEDLCHLSSSLGHTYVPVGSYEAERSFSLLRNLKTYTRSTMFEDRLVGLTMLGMHCSDAAALNTGDDIKKIHQRSLQTLSLPIFLTRRLPTHNLDVYYKNMSWVGGWVYRVLQKKKEQLHIHAN